MQSRPSRIVVTGVGAVTPLGVGWSALWQGLLAGRSGVRTIQAFDASDLPVRIAGEVPDFDPTCYLEPKLLRRTGRFAQFAHAAAQEALAQAEPALAPEICADTAVIVGTQGGLFGAGYQAALLHEQGSRRVDPLFISREDAYMAAARIGRHFGLRGPNLTVNSACASGADAIAQAVNLLRQGQAQAALAGGAEAMITPVALATLHRLGALSTHNATPEQASRPFDEERNGFVLAEGAALFVLEREEQALRRGAVILAEVAGVGWSFDACDDTAPDAQGQALAIRRALADAGIQPQALDAVVAHGTSTRLNDETETAALKLALGPHAYQVPVTAPKSMLGHTAGAAGAVGAAVALAMLGMQQVPAIANLTHPSPACDLDYVRGQARVTPLQYVLANAFGLGGQNCCLILRRWEGVA